LTSHARLKSVHAHFDVTARIAAASTRFANSTCGSVDVFATCRIDAYRHGKYPPASGDGFSLKLTGGKVAFNVLYADGHVGASVDRTEAFRACRMRYPE